MNLLSRAIIFCAIWATINCLAIKDNIEKNGSNDKETLLHNEINELVNQIKGVENVLNVSESRNETQSRQKRQLAVPLGFRSYDYGDYYGGLTGDYNYDYYDWVCSETRCQLCNILGGECCDPDANPNCFLPDSCLNNPCLAGGSCVTTRTIDGRPDFLCICLPGLTGKYCQITNDYIVDGFLPRVPIGPGFPPNGPFPPPGGFVAGGLVGGRVPIAGASNSGPYGYGQAQYQPAPAPAPAPAPSYQQYQPAPSPAPEPSYQQYQPAPAPSYQQYEPAAAPAPAPAPTYQQYQPAPAPVSVYQEYQPAPAPVQAAHQQYQQDPVQYYQSQSQAPQSAPVQQQSFGTNLNNPNVQQPTQQLPQLSGQPQSRMIEQPTLIQQQFQQAGFPQLASPQPLKVSSQANQFPTVEQQMQPQVQSMPQMPPQQVTLDQQQQTPQLVPQQQQQQKQINAPISMQLQGAFVGQPITGQTSGTAQQQITTPQTPEVRAFTRPQFVADSRGGNQQLLGLRRNKCPNGQIWSNEAQECVDFALASDEHE